MMHIGYKWRAQTAGMTILKRACDGLVSNYFWKVMKSTSALSKILQCDLGKLLALCSVRDYCVTMCGYKKMQ